MEGHDEVDDVARVVHVDGGVHGVHGVDEGPILWLRRRRVRLVRQVQDVWP